MKRRCFGERGVALALDEKRLDSNVIKHKIQRLTFTVSMVMSDKREAVQFTAYCQVVAQQMEAVGSCVDT